MKFYALATTTSTTLMMLPTYSAAYMMGGGFEVFGRHVTIRPGRVDCTPPCSSSQESEFYRRLQQQYSQQERRNVDISFEKLMREFSGREAPSTEKQKEWVNRAFEMFSELNRDVATSEENFFQYDEALRKQQKWANKVIEFAAEMAADAKQNSYVAVPPNSTTPDAENDKMHNESEIEGTKQELNDPIVVTPRHSVVMNDDNVFQVEVELPGVSIDAVDVAVDKEDELLTIRGERPASSHTRVTKFSKSFGLDPAIDKDKISAKLTNGILVVTAPKFPKKTNEVKRIPIAS